MPDELMSILAAAKNSLFDLVEVFPSICPWQGTKTLQNILKLLLAEISDEDIADRHDRDIYSNSDIYYNNDI